MLYLDLRIAAGMMNTQATQPTKEAQIVYDEFVKKGNFNSRDTYLGGISPIQDSSFSYG